MSGNKKEPRIIWEKLGDLDYRWLYGLSIILMVIPIIQPIGLPTQVGEATKGFYNAIVNLPPGSVVCVLFSGSAGYADEQEAGFVATWKVLFEHNLKVIFVSTAVDSEIILNNELGKMVNPESYGKKYGIDYVRLGYAPLDEVGQASFAQNIRGIFAKDVYGTPLDEIPLMKDINNYQKIDLLYFQYLSCTDIEWVIRQWVVPYGTKAIVSCTTACGPMAAPYYPKQIQGFIAGSGQGTELEILSKNPGRGAVLSDSKNFGILGLLLFIVFGNISYFGKKFGKRGE